MWIGFTYSRSFSAFALSDWCSKIFTTMVFRNMAAHSMAMTFEFGLETVRKQFRAGLDILTRVGHMEPSPTMTRQNGSSDWTIHKPWKRFRNAYELVRGCLPRHSSQIPQHTLVFCLPRGIPGASPRCLPSLQRFGNGSAAAVTYIY